MHGQSGVIPSIGMIQKLFIRRDLQIVQSILEVSILSSFHLVLEGGFVQITFGHINVELPLAMLLYHFYWELPSGMKNEDLDKTESFRATQRRKNDLYLIPNPHQPSFPEAVK